jgi:hypothetical protein
LGSFDYSLVFPGFSPPLSRFLLGWLQALGWLFPSLLDSLSSSIPLLLSLRLLSPALFLASAVLSGVLGVGFLAVFGRACSLCGQI